MVFSDINSLANSLMTKYSAPNGLGAASMAEASRLVRTWAYHVKKTLRSEMYTAFYMPYAPKVYGRTGRIFDRIEISYSNGIAEAKAKIQYGKYPSESFLSSHSSGRWDVMQLLEHGYSSSPKMPNWMQNYPYCGSRPGAHLMEKVANSLQGAAAAQGVTITYSG